MNTTKQAMLMLGLTSWLPLAAQLNLVPNPGFEEYITCPSYLASMPTYPTPLYTVKNWFSPTAASPDYFNECANPNISCGVPQNELSGYSPAHGGKGYTGIWAYYGPRPNYREYISTELIQPLKENTLYTVSYYIWLGKSEFSSLGVAAIPSLNCAFTTHMNLNDSTILLLNPQVVNNPTHFLDDTTQWMEVSGLYKAKGDEKFMTIGNFVADSRLIKKSVIAPGEIGYYLIDDVSITIFDSSNFNADTTLCEGDSVTYGKRPKADSCVWFDGSKQDSRTFKHGGLYWVASYYSNVFTIIDTFEVSYINLIHSHFDTSACNVKSIELTSQKGLDYLWSTKQTTQSIIIKRSGTYWVTRSIPGCTITDSFTASLFPGPTIPFVNDTAVCFDQITEILLDAGEFKDYLWKPTNDTSRVIYSRGARPYLLTITDFNNCTASKRFEVMESCPDYLFVPNAFTPNGDGLNDVFLPQTRSIEAYELIILNRWGQIVFTTHDTEQGWDGQDAPADVYVLHINYQPKDKLPQSLSKTITLLK